LLLQNNIVKFRPNCSGASRRLCLAVLCAIAIGPGDAFAYAPFARTAMPQAPSSSQDSAASTYPIELMELQQWLTRNPGLSDKALAGCGRQAVWDPSVQSMAAHGELDYVVKGVMIGGFALAAAIQPGQDLDACAGGVTDCRVMTLRQARRA
jgi:hypothetical protein